MGARSILGRTFVGQAAKGFKGIINPGKLLSGTMKTSSELLKALSVKDAKTAGLKSMQLLGTASGITYGTRILRGRSMFKDSSGKRDLVPYIPFL